MEKKQRRHTIDSVFTLVLFTVFAILALFVTAAGATAYKNTAGAVEQRYNTQTCLSYLTAKIRANNTAGAVSAESLDNIDSLCFTENIDGTDYATYIYYYDGGIRELFCRKDLQLSASTGTEIAQAQALTVEIGKNGSLTLTLTDSAGQKHLLTVGTVWEGFVI